jgi:hypothetical protein
VTCDSSLPVVTARARYIPHLPAPRVPTVYRLGYGPDRSRPGGHGKTDQGLGYSPLPCQEKPVPREWLVSNISSPGQ